MGKHRKKRRSRKSSSGVRDALGSLCLVVILLVLGQVAYEFAREERWVGSAVSAGLMVLLLLFTWLSLRHGRISLGRGGRTTSKR